MRELLLMRHAKSDRAGWSGADHERPLNDRGVRAAKAVGSYLSSVDRIPDLVVSSSAVRARTTAELAAGSGEWHIPIRIDERLYGSGPMAVVGIARELDDSVQRAMLVGHEPTWSMAVSGFIGGGSVGMPTAAVALLQLRTTSWQNTEWGTASLEAHVIPRLLPASGA